MNQLKISYGRWHSNVHLRIQTFSILTHLSNRIFILQVFWILNFRQEFKTVSKWCNRRKPSIRNAPKAPEAIRQRVQPGRIRRPACSCAFRRATSKREIVVNLFLFSLFWECFHFICELLCHFDEIIEILSSFTQGDFNSERFNRRSLGRSLRAAGPFGRNLSKLTENALLGLPRRFLSALD